MHPHAGAQLPVGRAALTLAHPGHELRVFHWIEQARPVVFVLTDGSGSGAEGRIQSTASLLAEIDGVEAGSVFGRFTDRAIYEAILDHDFGMFIQIADELADAFVEARIDYVVSDAEEEYNPSHDVCRMLVENAVALAQNRRPGLRSYDFMLVGPPDSCPEELRAEAIWLSLDAEALQRKLAAAAGYPELQQEVARAVERYGIAPFSTECLRPAPAQQHAIRAEHIPYYEQYGEQRVAEGVYNRVLRYREHMLPLAEALRGHVAAVC